MADEAPKISPAPATTSTAPATTTTSEHIGQPALGPTAAPAAEAPSMFNSMLYTMVPIVVIFYFLVLRPDSKRRQEQTSLLSKMKKGDKVLLTVGIYGTIGDIDGDEVTLIIDAKTNAKMKIRKEAVGTILNGGKE